MSRPLPAERVWVTLADELPVNRRALPALAVESLTTPTLELERDMLSASNELTAAEERRFVRCFRFCFLFLATVLHLAARLCDFVTRHFLAVFLVTAWGEACATATSDSAITAARSPLIKRRGWGVMRGYLSGAPPSGRPPFGKGSQSRWRGRPKAPLRDFARLDRQDPTRPEGEFVQPRQMAHLQGSKLFPERPEPEVRSKCLNPVPSCAGARVVP